MKLIIHNKSSILRGVVCVGLLFSSVLAGCPPQETGREQPPAGGGDEGQDPQQMADANTTSACSVTTHEAATFFDTVTYFMAAQSGHPFSPDGTTLLLTSDESGVFNAYAQSVTGGDDGDGRVALTDSTTDAVMALSYFPSDERILYTSDVGGNEQSHIYVREEDGTVRDLTPGDAVKASFVGWNEDGSALRIITNERDARFFDLYSCDVADDGNNCTMVYQNDLGGDIAAVSPNGLWVALVKRRTTADSDVYLADLRTPNRTAVLVTEHEGNVLHGVHDFSKDGATLIYSTDEFGEFMQAWTLDLETGGKDSLIEADWDVTFVSLSPTGRYRVSGINADAQTEVTIWDTASGEEVDLPALPAGDVRNVRFSAGEETVAFIINSDTSPSNVFVVSLETKELVQLTNALSSLMSREDLVDGQIVRYKSFDDLDIPSILYRPQIATVSNKVPALVWVHGGPGGQSTKGYSAAMQHLVNHGFAILAANNRGSSGYGKTFYDMDNRRHGEVDLQDLVYGKTYLQSLDWVDPDRIGIIGGSYGGYLTVAALAFEPDEFDVGVDIFGVTNWLRTLTSIPTWWESYREALYDEMGDPATDEERLRRISPLFHADNITKPLLVVQGANDPRVLQVESDEIVEALRENGVPVEYLVFEDEGHGFRKKSNRIAASEAYVSFLTKYLKEKMVGQPQGSDGNVTETVGPQDASSGFSARFDAFNILWTLPAFLMLLTLVL